MRPNAFNYLEASWNSGNSSILQKKASILLGLKSFESRSLTDVFVETDLAVIPDKQFEQSRSGVDDIGDEIYRSFRILPAEESTEIKPEDASEQKIPDGITFLKGGKISESVLRGGIELDRYRVERTGDSGDLHLITRRDPPRASLKLASYATQEEAIASAYQLNRLLIRLNTESEGFHIVEHILLRPSDTKSHGSLKIPGDFYPFKISVIFPAWTARFHDKTFREFAEETVQINCPAHIYPEFYWLDFPQMREFEGIFRKWLETKSRGGATPKEIDTSSRNVIKFLLQIRPEVAPIADDQA